MFRPIYHFTPEKNWMNDPNGVCYYKGEYHLFYQYNPGGADWGNLHWGHAKSPDLVHWERLEPALAPSNEKGEVHCFSGCISVDGGEPLLWYTSVGDGERNSRVGAEQWLAVTKDDMRTFEKYPDNPMLTAKDNGVSVLEWRDPYIVSHDGVYYMVLGASYAEKGCVLIYTSEDRIHWTYRNILLKTEKDDLSWECPNLLFFGDTAVLCVSPYQAPVYYAGTMNRDLTMTATGFGQIDYGGFEGFYAPNSFLDGNGRHIMIGWMPEASRDDCAVGADWRGVQSLPRILSWENNGLRMGPAEELRLLRKKGETTENLTVGTFWKSGISGQSAEVVLELGEADEQTEFRIRVFAAEDGSEWTGIHYLGKNDSVTVEREHASTLKGTHTSPIVCGCAQTQEGRLTLHIFIDVSTVEVFINDREAISARVYPIGEESCGILLENAGAEPLCVKSLQIYEMENIWEHEE